MATTFYCKSDKHDKCDGKVIMGAPQPMTVERCKCKCHKKEKNVSQA